MKYKYILFDLDGTLTDSKEGIINAVQHALKKYGIVEEDVQSLEKFIGPPLKDSFMEFCNFSEEKAEEATKYYREYYKEKGLFENKVYEGVIELLDKLNILKFVLIVATSKPEIFAKRILKHFNLDKYFTDIVGSNMDNTRSKKGQVIKYVIEKHRISDLSSVLMIGDRKHDMIGAKQNNIDAMGITYGYGSYEELQKAGADYIEGSVEEVYTKIISL
ncbi:HAD family hydrolase [Clostridium oryzae]|uniref:5'-nucleotidase n=1 Tax=Clostridium oryzae TaxID=1450648 RepID=A0A1V4IKV4_9CLOT|nr:HAD family hydrolase [Clostridium oryzae]OPJ60499.1 5'-nucleotidase [Clostridium oryzae]